MLPQGIGEAMRILAFQDALAGRRRSTVMEETFRRMVAVFERQGVQWALIGAHAINLLVQPRATVDVDFVVEGRRMRSVLEGLRQEFGDLDTTDLGAALRIPSLSVDLVRSDNHPLFREALVSAVDREGVKVPPPELLLVLKFLAAVSPWRKLEDRQQDAADLTRVYRTLGEDLDRAAAIRYATRAYPGAERELEAMLDAIDRGEDPSV
jgi:hypothetical protein